jgi:hypothetical protein
MLMLKFLEKGGIVKGKNISQTLRAGATTYFLDIEVSQAGKPYLDITESRFKAEGSRRQRASIIVFPEHISEFLQVLHTIARGLEQSQ